MKNQTIAHVFRSFWQLVIGHWLVELAVFLLCLAFPCSVASLVLLVETGSMHDIWQGALNPILTMSGIFSLAALAAGTARFIETNGMDGLEPKLFRFVLLPFLR